MDEDETVEKQVEGLVDKVVAEDEARRAEELVRSPSSLASAVGSPGEPER